ncbi:MAG: VacJ family lipoprotein [Patescibacteria group bacterium]
MKILGLGILLLAVSLFVVRTAGADAMVTLSADPTVDTTVSEMENSQMGMGGETAHTKDPFRGFNKAMFVFNDKAYRYFFKPIHTGYSSIVPPKARGAVKDAYINIKMPIRFFNCLFQGKFKGAGKELARFVVNSTVGVGGFWDPATKLFHIKKEDRDFGQTLGKCKLNPGPYLVLPFVGPTNTRDMFGDLIDTGLNPVSWVSFFFLTPVEAAGNFTYEGVNNLSTGKGKTYEDITKPALDPYIALQDAYMKYREKKVKE